MRHLKIWLGMIAGSVILAALGLVEFDEIVPAIYWSGFGILACWWDSRLSGSATVTQEK